MADSSVNDDYDVPPLEDMSQLLDQMKLLQNSSHNDGIPDSDIQQTATNVNAENQVSKNITESSTKSFGGFKKGFLFGESPIKKTKGKSEKKLPLIKPASNYKNSNDLHIPEVQDAMKVGQVFSENQEWITDDLLSKVKNNNTLFQRMEDPRFMQAISEFQANPQQALEKYKNNLEIQSFFTEICKILGGHFEKLTDSQTLKQKQKDSTSNKLTNTIITKDPTSTADIEVHRSTNPSVATAEDEQKIQNILAMPDVREALQDNRVQKLIEMLKMDPNKAQHTLREANVDLKKKIETLVGAGLLQFEFS